MLGKDKNSDIFQNCTTSKFDMNWSQQFSLKKLVSTNYISTVFNDTLETLTDSPPAAASFKANI